MTRWMLGAMVWMLGDVAWMLGAVAWMLGAVLWMLGAVAWMLGQQLHTTKRSLRERVSSERSGVTRGTLKQSETRPFLHYQKPCCRLDVGLEADIKPLLSRSTTGAFVNFSLQSPHTYGRRKSARVKDRACEAAPPLENSILPPNICGYGRPPLIVNTSGVRLGVHFYYMGGSL
eukprot:2654400-Pyramimonas_sp.AAC.2